MASEDSKKKDFESIRKSAEKLLNWAYCRTSVTASSSPVHHGCPFTLLIDTRETQGSEEDEASVEEFLMTPQSKAQQLMNKFEDVVTSL